VIQVDSNFIKRQKNHFVDFFNNPPIGCIIGNNGYVWIYTTQDSGESRMRMASLRNAIACLERQKVPIFKETIVKVLE
jgi:exosome complex RNA-binding protein Rrp4